MDGLEAHRSGAGEVAVFFEDFAGFVNMADDAGGGGLEQIGQDVHGADLPLVEQGEYESCRVVEERLVADLAGGLASSYAALFAATLTGAGGLRGSESRGQLREGIAAHADQTLVGQLREHGLTALGRTVLFARRSVTGPESRQMQGVDGDVLQGSHAQLAVAGGGLILACELFRTATTGDSSSR